MSYTVGHSLRVPLGSWQGVLWSRFIFLSFAAVTPARDRSVFDTWRTGGGRLAALIYIASSLLLDVYFLCIQLA